MDTELKAKIRNKLGIAIQAVNGMMQVDIDDEEKQGWIAIYNGAMRKIMNDYLAEDIGEAAPAPQAAPSEEPSAEAGEIVAEDVGGITNAE